MAIVEWVFFNFVLLLLNVQWICDPRDATATVDLHCILNKDGKLSDGCGGLGMESCLTD